MILCGEGMVFDKPDQMVMQKFVEEFDGVVTSELRRLVGQDDVDDCKNGFYERYFRNKNHLKHDASKGRSQANYVRQYVQWHVKYFRREDYRNNIRSKICYNEYMNSDFSNKHHEDQMEKMDILQQLDKIIAEKEINKPKITQVLEKLSEGKTVPEICQETDIKPNTIIAYKKFIRSVLSKIDS